MATGKRYYWLKLKESFMTSDTIDYFMEQPNGANYVVLYQMLCLKTINTDGRLERQIGDVVIKYDIPKIQRDLKWFSADTIRVALRLYQSVGLIYEDENGVLVLSDYQNLVGSETDYAAQKKLQRSSSPKLLPTAMDNVHTDVHKNVHTDIEIEKEIENRDKSSDIRDKDKDKDKKKADAFSEFAGDDADLMSALTDFEKMRKSIKKPMTDRAKSMLVNKLAKDFPPHLWIPVLEQSISHCWADVYELKERDQQRQAHSAMDDLRQLHEMFGDES